MSYDPQSNDAMFARILEEIRHLNVKVDEIREQVYKTNGRVTSLEHDKWYQRGVVAIIGIAIAGIWDFFIRK